MLGVSEQQLRSWERHGLIRGEAPFSFSDLIALKTLQKLRENRVPPRKIGRCARASVATIRLMSAESCAGRFALQK